VENTFARFQPHPKVHFPAEKKKKKKSSNFLQNERTGKGVQPHSHSSCELSTKNTVKKAF
jgi:hypothetical protein